MSLFLDLDDTKLTRSCRRSRCVGEPPGMGLSANTYSLRIRFGLGYL